MKRTGKVDKFHIHFCKMQVVCLAAGILFYVAAEAAGMGNGSVEGGKIRRPFHGQGEKEYEIYINGLEEKEVPMVITVGEKQYGEEEAEEVFKKAWQELLQVISAENQSLSDVRSDLNLPVWMEEYGLRIRWFSENQSILNNYGKVFNENNLNLPESGTEVWLRAVMSDGERSKELQIPVRIYSPAWTEKEQRERGLSKAIEEEDIRQRQEEWLTLPKEYEGRTLNYGEKGRNTYLFFPVTGFLMAVLYGFKEQQDERNERKRKERQLLLDYSEIVSRLMVFIGAGMTVRGAWGKIVEDYEKRLEERRGKRRYAFEEMSKTYYQITSGKAEGEAYEEFGRRCGLQPYMKLSGMLIQNRKEGMKNINQMMGVEMAAAFEERKNLAKRRGEEAGTKLLAPLFIMLGVVMVMVMVPAMLAFS